MYDFFKRIMDILISLLIIPFVIIIYFFVGLAIKIEDNGPIIYKAKRIGKDFKLFDMYKFRSMKVNSPIMYNADGSSFSEKNDPRVTKVGRFIRATSIDELPQFFNVLKGDMSIIGPRASGDDSLGTFKDDEKDKMLVKPGITGYCQAYYRNSASPRKKRLKDSWYANNYNFFLDIKIFFKTIYTVFKRENVYSNNIIIDEKIGGIIESEKSVINK